jgi:alpha-glucosidase
MSFKHFTLAFLCLYTLNTTAQSTASKQVTTFTIQAPQLDTLKTIWAYLPKNYDNSKKNYPVVYMHDAQNLFDKKSSYAGEWKVDDFLDQLDGHESIIIGIEHGNTNRLDELTPFPNATYGGGKGDAYLDFIINNLKPYVDTNYRTKPEPMHTTIFGSSLGGLMSFYAVLKHPDTFSKAGVFSPSFWINPEIYGLVKQSQVKKNSKFFFLAGTDESETMVEDMERMVLLLNKKGTKKNNKVVIIDGGQHNENLWSTYFGEAYLWLF